VDLSRKSSVSTQAIAVRFRNVSCDFEHRSGAMIHALQQVSFDVPAGQFVCILGRSGHGKTTLLRVLAGLQGATDGSVLVRDRAVTGPGSDRPMVFQQDSVFPWMHVRDNVEFALRVKHVPKRERRRISDRWLDEVGLSAFAESWPRELSGGMRKRVALAAVLASDADVWLMDEPFGSLDYFTRRGLHDVLLALWAETGKTVFFVTHDIEESLILADRILVMNEGRLVDDLPVHLPRPRTEEVRATQEAVVVSRAILEKLGVEAGAAGTTSDGEAAEGVLGRKAAL
jgi:ABC-type nitrate/sulfonate/bicarbonate transport system ATPase subunit